MLADFFIAILWLLATIIHALLSVIPISVPVEVGQSVVFFAGYVRYAGGFIDIPGVFGAFSFMLDFLTAYFTYKVIMWTYHLVASRSVHPKQSMPTQGK